MFDFLKKNKGEVPPDIGQEDSVGKKKGEKTKADIGDDVGSGGSESVEEMEEVGEEDLASSSGEEEEIDTSGDKPVGADYGVDEDEEEPEEKSEKKKGKGSKKLVQGRSVSSSLPRIGGVTQEKLDLELEKIKSRMEAMASLINGYSERLSVMTQQIGEVRAMNLATEKSIARMSSEAAKAADIVREVKPERLRVEYQKMDLKAQELYERIEANKQFADTIIDELKDVKRKMKNFLGTEELLKLNDDVKKDLIETQQLAARARLHSDKTEQLFSEMRRGLADAAKIEATVATLDSNYSGMKKEVERLKIDFSKIVNQDDFDGFKKNVNNKLVGVDQAFESFERIKDENGRLTALIERILAITQKNKQDIGNIALAVGEDSVKRVSDYDNRLDSVLSILDSLAGQIAELKAGGVKVKKSKNEVKKDEKKFSKVDEEELPEGGNDRLAKMEKEVGGAANAVGVKSSSDGENNEEEKVGGLRAKIEKAFGLDKGGLFGKKKGADVESAESVEGVERAEKKTGSMKKVSGNGEELMEDSDKSDADDGASGEDLMEEDSEVKDGEEVVKDGGNKEEADGSDLMEGELGEESSEESEEKSLEKNIMKKKEEKRLPEKKIAKKKLSKKTMRREVAKKRVAEMKKKLLGGRKLDDESEAIKSAVQGDRSYEHSTIEPVVGIKLPRRRLSLKELEQKMDEVSPETKKLIRRVVNKKSKRPNTRKGNKNRNKKKMNGAKKRGREMKEDNKKRGKKKRR